MINEPVKIGVIGCGGYAFQLIKRILSVSHAGTITAATSRDMNSSGAQYCRERGIRVFQTVEEMLVFGQFEVVVNPTPIHLHATISKQCLTAGFPVFMEKPPVATVQEFDDLAAASKAAGLPVAVCFNSLYAFLVQQLKKELLAGRFGKVLRVKSIGAWTRTDAYFTRNSWAGKVQQNGQWILDGDINNPFAHVLCNSLFFAGTQQNALAEPLTVEAELYRCNQIESEDTSCLRIMTREGVELLTWFTLGSKTEIAPRTVIETEKAVITFENFKTLKIEFTDGTVEEHEAYQEDRIEMIQQLCRAIRTGEQFCGDLDMIRPFTVVINGAFDSAGTICSIPEQYLSRVKVGTATQIVIEGAGETLKQAFAANALFSEMGAPWARKNEKFSTENYTRFPLRFDPKAS
ncbi:MAG: Gfo/Idh/MocA family oxidoreductase [Kiritimatiellales bacterium]